MNVGYAFARFAAGSAHVLLVGAIAMFMLAPLVIVAVVSFSNSPVFALPTEGLSLRWYESLGQLDSFFESLRLSVQVAGAATVIALLIGTPAAIAVHFGRFPGAGAISTFVLSPIMLPGLVLGIAMLQATRWIGFDWVVPTLILAHGVVTTPFVMRTVLAGLTLFDPTLLKAARTLGCSPLEAFRRVLLPNLLPSVMGGAVFGFLASFDNYPVSMFLTDAFHRTVPIQMLQYLEESPDPTLAAISSLLLGLAMGALILLDRLVGLKRLAQT